MKQPLDAPHLPSGSVFVACSSHEDRCLGLTRACRTWRPKHAVVFHYDDPNPRRDANHGVLQQSLGESCKVTEIPFTERDAVTSFHEQRRKLLSVIAENVDQPIVADISVFTKRHLLMLLRWLDDHGCWERLWIVYSEPQEYEVEGHMPLSFGISCVEQIPGFSAAPDPSRPLHVAMFLGYEGDRAFATYELLQPRTTTLIIPDPPFRESWRGRTEALNRDLLAVVGGAGVAKADSLDPAATVAILSRVLGGVSNRADFSRAICPLGTKPQTLGAYLYLREASDPPALIYTGPLRHNHSYYSRGVGPTWLIHRPS